MHLDFRNTQFGMEAPILYFTKEKISIDDGVPII